MKGELLCSFNKFSQLILYKNVYLLEISQKNLYVDIGALEVKENLILGAKVIHCH